MSVGPRHSACSSRTAYDIILRQERQMVGSALEFRFLLGFGPLPSRLISVRVGSLTLRKHILVKVIAGGPLHPTK